MAATLSAAPGCRRVWDALIDGQAGLLNEPERHPHEMEFIDVID